MCSSTVIPVLVVSTPAASRPSSSTFGTRPDASSTRSARRSYGSEPSRGAIVAITSSPSWRTRWTKTFVAELDPLVLERRCERGRRLGVGERRDPLGRVDDPHLGAEARERLTELEPDRAAPDDQQRARHLGQVERRDVVEPVDLVDPLDRRHCRARAGCDQDPVGLELALADAERVRPRERRLPAEGREARALEVAHPLFLRLLQRLLPRPDTREVDPRRPGLDPEHRRARVDVVRELRRDEVGLGRRAGDVGAAPAPAHTLDQRHAGVVVAHRHVRAVPGRGASAEHHQVESFGHERHCLACEHVVTVLAWQ